MINKHKIRNKNLYDKPAKPLNLQQNDLVWIQKEPYNKHCSIYEGPYLVKEIDGVNVTVFDTKTKKERILHKNRLRKKN